MQESSIQFFRFDFKFLNSVFYVELNFGKSANFADNIILEINSVNETKKSLLAQRRSNF